MATLLVPVYIMFFVLIVFILGEAKYKQMPFKHWLIPALLLKFFGVLAFAFIYQYYYDGGDTFGYFEGAQIIAQNILYNPSIGFELLFTNADTYNLKIIELLDNFQYFEANSTWLVSKFAAIFSIFSFNDFMLTSLWFAFFSFLGQIALFRLFYRLQPSLWFYWLIAVFAIPSVIFWGGGIMKDTIVLMFLGPLFYSFYWMLKGERLLIAPIVFITSFSILWTIKYYVPLAALPALLLWGLLYLFSKIPSWGIRVIFATSITIFAFSAILLFYNQFQNQINSVTESIIGQAIGYQAWHGYLADNRGASGYDLGEIDYSFWGMVAKAPASINVALFRPYLWEANKIVLVVSALENTIILLFTLFVFIKTGIFKSISILFSKPYLLAFTTFTLIFAFMVGFTSFNFGALVRYKIPCLAFFLMLLFTILNHHNVGFKKPL